MCKIVIGKSINDGDLLIPSRLLIQANSGGGKSYLLRRLMNLPAPRELPLPVHRSQIIWVPFVRLE